jgi:chemotaxis protein histidine kinase CheA
MVLAESHRQLFLDECSRLTVLVYKCLKTLEKNPSDSDAIERMVNAADVIRSGAKFLEDKEMEQSAKLLIELFKGVQDVRERQEGFAMVCNLFGKMSKSVTAILN